MSVRTQLIQALRDVVADYDEAVQVIGVEDNADEHDSRIRIMVKQRTLAPLPQAPTQLRVDYVLTITHPAIDAAVSEVELDDFVPSLLSDLRTGRGWLGWTSAQKINDEGHMGYDVDLYVIGGPRGEGKG